MEKNSEYFLRCAWDTTCQERDSLKDQVKALSAIKSGLERSLLEAIEKIKELEFGLATELKDILTDVASAEENQILGNHQENRRHIMSAITKLSKLLRAIEAGFATEAKSQQ